MKLDMALGSAAPTSFQHRYGMTTAFILIVCVALTKSAPTTYDEIQAKRTDLADYFNDPNGCYYNYQHYEEGDRIVTNEPCLNCTCHNRMLMCYLRVCPFSKAIGQDCTVQKSPDQCCPVISCPEVPVHLLTSSTTPTPTTTTEIGWHDNYGCMMDENEFFPDGAQVPPNPKKPCELCYCIRNRTACIMQECTLHVEGCRPVYHEGVCCPVRYDCDYENEKSTTSAPQITGGLVFSTTSAPFDCRVNDDVYRDGESIAMVSEKPCEHCYCMRGDIVCAVQDCGEPLRGKDCTPETPPAGQCCPTSYQCANETNNSYDITTLQAVLLSDSDENEAEKFPINEDIYNKLGETHTPNEENEGNEVESDHSMTISPDNHNTAEETNILPENDSTNNYNEANQQESSSTLPNLTDKVNVGSESGQDNYDSTNKPNKATLVDDVQPTQLPASELSTNENAIGSSTQTTPNNNDNVKVDIENNSNEIPEKNPINEDPTSNFPISSTHNFVEGTTYSYNIQENPQVDITTESISIADILKVENGSTEQNKLVGDTTSETGNQSDSIKTPIEQNNQDSPQSEIVSETEIPNAQNEPIVENASGTGNQPESDKTPAEQSNQDSPQSENVSVTEIPSVQNEPTEQNQPIVDNASGTGNQAESDKTPVEQNNQDNPQSEIVSVTEIPSVQNEPTEQNQPIVDNASGTGNQPESDKTPAEQNNQDTPQSENVSVTEIPSVQNEPTEQNQPIVDNASGTGNQSESNKTPVEQNNQDTPQSENVSVTEIPSVQNEPTEQNQPLVDNASGTGNQPESDKTPVEQNNQDNPQSEIVSVTEIPSVQNEPTEQNQPIVDNASGTGNQPESDKTPVEQNNQDTPQSENVSVTEIPSVQNEPTEQNQPIVDNASGTGNQPESDKTPVEQNNQDTPQSENVSVTEIPSVQNEPTEQNQPIVDNASGTGNQPDSDKTPVEQNNQDNPQSEIVSVTEIPSVQNEPTEQNQPIVDNASGTGNQAESDKTPVEQNNQDNPQSEIVSVTEIPSVQNEPTEQNQPIVDNASGTGNQPESNKTPAEQNNQDTPQSENVSVTEIPSVQNEPTEQNQPLVDNASGTGNQPESDKIPVEQNNQENPQSEIVSVTEIPSVQNEPTEQNQPIVDNASGTGNQPESDKTPVEQNNQENPQSEIVSATEIPNAQNEPIVEIASETGNQPESDKTPVEQNNQDSPQSENVSVTEIPSVQNEPTEQNQPIVDNASETGNQSESDKTQVEQNNQDNPQSEIVSATEIPSVQNEPTEQNQPIVDNASETGNQPESDKTQVEQNNQDNPQSEIVSATEIPSVQNEPTEQNQPIVDNASETGNQPESDKTQVEQNNQENPQSEIVSATEIPNAQNEPIVDNASGTGNQPESDKTQVEQNNQDNPQSEIVSATEIPSVQNEPTEQNQPIVDNASETGNQPESDKTQVEQNNQDNPQSEIVSATEIPSVQNEPTEQNQPIVDNASETGNQPESDKTQVEQNNQDNPQSEIVTATEIPNAQNEPIVDTASGTGNQPESDKTPVEHNNQDNPQSEIVSETEIPNAQNEPIVENASGTGNQPESDKTPVEQNNQVSPQSEIISATEIPSVQYEPTEQNQPIVDNASGTGNQPESDKTPVEQNNQDIPQSEIVSVTEVPNAQNEPIVDNASGTKNQPESDNTAVEQNNQDNPQSNNKVTENNPIQPIVSENDASTEQPNEDNNIFVVTPTTPPLFSDNQVKGDDSASIINENNAVDKTVNSKPSTDDKTSLIENTDTSNILPDNHTDVVAESLNVVTQPNSENKENLLNIKPINNKDDNAAVMDSAVTSHEQLPAIAEHNDNRVGSNNPLNLEPVLTPTTEINHEVNTEVINHGILIDNPPSQENQPINMHSGEKDESAPDSVDQQITHQTETPEELTNKYPLSANEHTYDVTTSLPQQQSVENNILAVHPQIINASEITTQDETKTQSDVSANGLLEQSSVNDVPTEIVGVQNSEEVSKPTELPVLHSSNDGAPEQNNEYESATPQEQSQDENVNEILDQTSVYPDISSDEKNNLVTSTESSLINGDDVTPSSDKIETNLNSQVSDENPIKNTNENVPVESATIQAISGNIGNNADNVVTTNSYADLPSTNAPGHQMVENEVNSPVNPTNTVETNINNDRPENVVPQLSSNEASTQYNQDDSSTNSPIQESPNVNIINNVEVSTNAPNNPESSNVMNQDSNTESELYTTQSPIDIPLLNVIPIIDGKPSESTQNADKPLVSKTPDHAIDITTSVYSESSNAPELNEPVDSISEVTTLNENKNSDVVTEMYENVQPGVPGEGSCLIDFVTYAHKAEVPKSNPCHEKCECLNSIVTCTSVNCPPAPPQHRNCIPLHPGNESWCCPTYMCEGGIEGMLFDSHNQLGSPQLISTVVLEDKPNEVNDKNPQTDEDISSTQSPQISQEYNTVTPSQFDSNSNINAEDSIDVTEVPAHTEIPYMPIENYVTTEDASQPIKSDQLTENNKPTKIDQPINNSEADSTTTSYVIDDQSITNKPETPNNNEEQNVLHNTVNVSQDYLAPSTQVPENYEPAVTNVLPNSDQNRPGQNSESDVSISITTYKPNYDSIVNQQQVFTDNKTIEETNNPPVNEDFYTSPIDIVTDLPVSEINPLEVGTQIPTVIADEKPMVSGNNVDGLRPASIDDIISSIYLVKDSVQNSLETSSKPTETSNEEIGLFENDYHSITTPEDFPSDQYNNNESQTTVSSINSTPESQKTDVVNETSPESSSATTEANISLLSENAADGLVGVTQIPNISPQFEVNSVEQGVSTDLPSNGPEVEATVDDSKTPVESPTTQSLPSSGEQNLANNGPETTSNPIVTQVQNAGKPSTESPASEGTVVVDDNKRPEINTPLTEQHEVPVDDTAVVVKPAAEEKPNDVNNPIISDLDVPVEVVTQMVVTGRPVVSTPDDSDKRFGEQSSSSFRPPVQGGDNNNHKNEHPRPETADAVHIPLDTETPAFNPSTNAPLATYPHKPSYTPIPQSTWTQKPFHQDSTSEAPLQPDQGFPDEYDDENEAVYGPGTCRYGGKVYVSAQQVPRDDPCDFCFCFRGDIICLQQSCPPPIFGCYQENIQGFCCPRYECPVAQATSVNVTTTTTSTTTMVPPHFFANAYRGAARRTGCLIHGHAYRVGEDVGIASGPCLECICGSDGKMKCDPKPCSPEPLLRKMMAEAVDQKRR